MSGLGQSLHPAARIYDFAVGFDPIRRPTHHTFVFRPNFGANTIADFDIHNDFIQFDKSVFHSVTEILAHISDSCGGALITDGRGDSILVQDVTAAQLVKHADGFHLA